MSRLAEIQALAQKVSEFPLAQVDPSAVALDLHLYPRESIHPDRVAVFVELYRAGVTFPPIWLAKDGQHLIDGAHRVWAARQADVDHIPARLLPVESAEDILILSVLANTPVVSLPLAKRDLDRVVPRMLTALQERYGDVKTGIKTVFGGLDELANLLGVAPVQARNWVRSLSGEPTPRGRGRSVSSKRHTAGESWETATVPEAVAQDLLRASTSPPPAVVSSPWMAFAQILVRCIRMAADLMEEGVAGFADAWGSLAEEDRQFLLDNKDVLLEVVNLLESVS